LEKLEILIFGMCRKIHLLFIINCLFTIVNAQNISNVTFRQVDKIVEVSYDLSTSERGTVDLYYSINGGKTYIGPLKQVQGAVGTEQYGGRGKIISWNVLAEGIELNGNVSFKITFKSNYKNRSKNFGMYAEAFGPSSSLVSSLISNASFKFEWMCLNTQNFDLAINFGAGLTQDLLDSDPIVATFFWESFPLGFNAIFFEDNHHLEIGAGILIFPMGYYTLHLNNSIGYRYQKTNYKGLIFRMGLNYDYAFGILLPQMSVGFNF